MKNSLFLTWYDGYLQQLLLRTIIVLYSYFLHPGFKIRSPTYSKNLAEITTKLIEKDAEGIVNVCGDEFLRLPDFMRRVASAMKLNPDLVKETPRKSYQPAFSAMSSEKRRYYGYISLL